MRWQAGYRPFVESGAARSGTTGPCLL